MKKFIFILLFTLLLIMALSSIQRDKCVVEIGTGTWCTYCPGAAMGADDLVTNGHPVAVIEYHGSDSFTNTESTGRISYYGLTGYPTAWFDGLNPVVGGNHTTSMYSSYLPRVNARMAVESHFTINASGAENNGTYNVNVVLDKVEPDTNSNLRLHFVITESDIQYSWQGQTQLDFVERAMVTGVSGQTIDFGTGTQLVIPLSFTMNPAWDIDNCEIVIFIQNNTSKEILQGTKYTFPEIFGANPVSVTEINFPDTYITNTATVPMQLRNFWDTPLTGTITCDNPVFTITPADRFDFTVPPFSNQTYNVTFTPTIASTETGTITITTSLVDYPVITIPLTAVGYVDNAPTATNVNVSGIPVVTMLLSAAYSFGDVDNDMEGSSIYQWYRIDPNNPVPAAINDATGLDYRLTQDDIGNQIAFEVTPVDEHDMPGTTVMSDPTPTIEVLPPPQNLTAEVVNDHDVVLDWEPPDHFNNRDFLGYRIFRSGLIINTINFPNLTTFTDTWLNNGDYEYWITSIFSNPISQSDPSNVVSVHIGPTDNSDVVAPAIESVRVYPNPFNDVSSIEITGKANANVSARIYNIKGQLVQNLTGRSNSDGIANLTLQSSDNMIPGIYFVSVQGANKHFVQKVVLMK